LGWASGGYGGGVVEKIDTRRVRALLDDGAQALEVLPASEFNEEHLPGARNIPLPELTREAAGSLDADRPVVVYCYDTQCDLSSRGAALLEQYGFREVYDYTASKVAWLAMNLPAKGTLPARVRAGAHTRLAATCGPDATTDALPEPGPGNVVVVVDKDGIVLGAIRPEAAAARRRPVMDILQPAPPTVRPSIHVEELAKSMDNDGQDHVLVTTYEGTLLGVVLRTDLDVDR
jgi:rhodanese-related sulfurtransferase